MTTLCCRCCPLQVGPSPALQLAMRQLRDRCTAEGHWLPLLLLACFEVLTAV